MRYVSGKASLEEMAAVALAVSKDPSLNDLVSIMEKMNDNGCLNQDSTLPASDCAGEADNNLCDLMCEMFILRDYLDAKALEGANLDEDNIWLTESGMPLHSMGRLLEHYGMSVTRRYDCSASDILECLDNGRRAIAVVDSGKLWADQEDGRFHAVVCLGLIQNMIAVYDPIKDEGTVIKVFDPAAGSNMNYDFNRFLAAWRLSHNYLVVASPGNLDYQPHPIDVEGIGIDEELIELTEALAEDSHEVWALRRKAEGWTFGKERNDREKKHPDFRPYADLPESEKEYDRESAIHTIKLVKKLGFNIHKNYTLYCPECGEFVAEDMNYCPACGHKLDWSCLK